VAGDVGCMFVIGSQRILHHSALTACAAVLRIDATDWTDYGCEDAMKNGRQSHDVQAAVEEFLQTPLDTILALHGQTPGEDQALALFHSVADSVPAYRAFLAEHSIDPATVRTREEWHRVPVATKQNYQQRYSLDELCWNGSLESCDMIAVSSGSTGKPTFWPRYLTHELQITRRFEQVFHDSFQAGERRTLAVVCFALGTWVGGMYTASCCRWLAAKGYPVTVVTPGNNKEEIFRVVTELGPMFDQVVLLGYPPFLKDVIDSGIARGIDWKPLRVKMVMAGEVFSEEWRSLVAERIGSDSPCSDFASLYGTADAGVLGNETPLTICIRRYLADRPEAARSLFGESRLPTLVQYDPTSRFFEEVNGALVFTGDNGVPLIRYDILDSGGLVSYEEMLAFLGGCGFDPEAELKKSGIVRGIRPLPFVYLFGRSDFTVSFFGANVYPENVTVGLEQPGIREWVTGKFVLQALEDADRDRYLSVVVELGPGVEADDPKRQAIAGSIVAHLVRLNSEFANYVPAEHRTPKVRLLPAGDPSYFPVGVKHRYTRK
jgi:phenylacetate-CoA ligase